MQNGAVCCLSVSKINHVKCGVSANYASQRRVALDIVGVSTILYLEAISKKPSLPENSIIYAS